MVLCTDECRPLARLKRNASTMLRVHRYFHLLVRNYRLQDRAVSQQRARVHRISHFSHDLRSTSRCLSSCACLKPFRLLSRTDSHMIECLELAVVVLQSLSKILNWLLRLRRYMQHSRICFHVDPHYIKPSVIDFNGSTCPRECCHINVVEAQACS